MTAESLRLALLVPSAADGRAGSVVARWFTEQADQHGQFTTDMIDLAEAQLPVMVTARPGPEAATRLAEVTPRLDAADAFVVVTPEYNRAYPAVLKAAIDWHPTQWQAKPVALVCYGGISGGLRAVEQLRLVFAELHAVTLRDTVSFHNVWERFDEEGRPTEPDGCAGAVKTLLDQLLWWTLALGEARAKRPFQS